MTLPTNHFDMISHVYVMRSILLYALLLLTGDHLFEWAGHCDTAERTRKLGTTDISQLNVYKTCKIELLVSMLDKVVLIMLWVLFLYLPLV